MSIELGDRVKDVITGYEGIVNGRTKWLTGCDTIGILPTELDKDGKTREPMWVDVTRIEVIEKGAIKLGKGDKSEDNGGPHDAPTPTRGQS